MTDTSPVAEQPRERGPVAPQAPHSPSNAPTPTETPERAGDGHTGPRTPRMPLQLDDALWDAIAPPGPATTNYTEQHQRVCAVVAAHLADLAATHPDSPDSEADSSRTSPDNGLDDMLRAQYADAVAQEVTSGKGLLGIIPRIIHAVLAVRDRRMEQLAAGRQTWKQKALEMESDRDHLRHRTERLQARAEQAEDLLRVAHDTSNRSEAERAAAEQRVAQAEAANACVRAECDAMDQAMANGHASLSRLREHIAHIRAALDGVPAGPHSAEAERDQAYAERAALLAWLAALHPANAVITPAPDVDEPGWLLLYLLVGGWQMSWHISPRDADLFAHVEQVEPTDPRAQWDGHSTEEKYQRLQEHTERLGEHRHRLVTGGVTERELHDAVRKMARVDPRGFRDMVRRAGEIAGAV